LQASAWPRAGVPME